MVAKVFLSVVCFGEHGHGLFVLLSAAFFYVTIDESRHVFDSLFFTALSRLRSSPVKPKLFLLFGRFHFFSYVCIRNFSLILSLAIVAIIS